MLPPTLLPQVELAGVPAAQSRCWEVNKNAESPSCQQHAAHSSRRSAAWEGGRERLTTGFARSPLSWPVLC